MKWHDYVFVGLSLFCLFGLGYSWVWWFKTGRHQPGERSGKAVTALAYNTLPAVAPYRVFPQVLPSSQLCVDWTPFRCCGRASWH